MTPEERAEKVFVACMPWDKANQIRLIAAEIRAAVEEQKKQCAIDHSVNINKAKAGAYEDAAKIAEYCYTMRTSGYECDHGKDIADALRARAKDLK